MDKDSLKGRDDAMNLLDANYERRRHARRGLVVYGGVVLGLSALFEGAIIAAGGAIENHTTLVLALMWSPAAAMLVARLVLREGVRDVSFRLGYAKGGWRAYRAAWLYPAAVGAAAYGLAWATGLAPFAVPEGGLLEEIGGGSATSFMVSLGLTMTVGVLLSAISALGEELGWRGYMTSRLIDAEIPRPALVSGLLWAAWHTPLILSGQYAAGPSPLLSTAMFVLILAGQGYLYTRVRMQSGSVWPAVLLHSTWNSVIQGTFDGFVPGHGASHAGNIWVGEAGIVVVAIATLFTIALVWKPFPLRRYPLDPEAGMGSLRTL